MSFPIIKSHLSLSLSFSLATRRVCADQVQLLFQLLFTLIYFTFSSLAYLIPCPLYIKHAIQVPMCSFIFLLLRASFLRFVFIFMYHFWMTFVSIECVWVCVMHTFVALKRSNLFGHRLHQCERRWGETVTVPGIANEGLSVSFAFINFFIRPRFLPVPLFPFFSRLPLFPSFLVWFAHLSGGREKKCVFSLKVPSHKSKCKNIFVENYASYYTSVL